MEQLIRAANFTRYYSTTQTNCRNFREIVEFERPIILQTLPARNRRAAHQILHVCPRVSFPRFSYRRCVIVGKTGKFNDTVVAWQSFSNQASKSNNATINPDEAQIRPIISRSTRNRMISVEVGKLNVFQGQNRDRGSSPNRRARNRDDPCSCFSFSKTAK